MSPFISILAIVLSLVALVLLAVIAVMGNAVISIAGGMEKKQKSQEKPCRCAITGQCSKGKSHRCTTGSLLLLFFMTSAPTSGAQEIQESAEAALQGGGPGAIQIFIYAALFVILIELLVIIGLFRTLQRLVNKQLGLAPSAEKKTQARYARLKAWWWNKVSRSVGKEEEYTIDLGHDYDGIRELDNPIPPWWSLAFLCTILFGAAYLYRYHVARSAPLQLAEYEQELVNAEKTHTAYLKKTASLVDETTVTMLGEKEIADGKAVFKTYCAACHGQEGGGGIGPNLTDNYWLHGGSISDIFKTIKYGVPDKGMIAWQDQLTPVQIAQLSSYIKSVTGSKPAGAKEPQGELFEEPGTGGML